MNLVERRALVALCQGDPAGIGPEICLREVGRWSNSARYVPLLVAEREVVKGLRRVLPEATSKVRFLARKSASDRSLRDRCGEVAAEGLVPALCPVEQALDWPEHAEQRESVVFGRPSVQDARGALLAIELAVDLCLDDKAHAMVTGPVNKAVIATHIDASFRGHTDFIAQRCAERRNQVVRYGKDYLMAFLGEELKVALLSTHVPLREAIDQVSEESVVEALHCLNRAIVAGGKRIALAALNPHAGEGGLLGQEDDEILAPAVARARLEGVDVRGPESADTLFSRARRGAFDWVLALYHDQGLIAVKTLAFGETVNWTAGLEIVRTSVDHGTAYALAGRGEADPRGMFAAVDTAVEMAAVR